MAFTLCTFNSAAWAGATLTDDSFVSSKTPSKTNGVQPALVLLNANGNRQTVLLKFNLDGSLPAGVVGGNIAKATLKVFVTKLKLSTDANATITADQASSTAWSEASVNGASGIIASGSHAIPHAISSSNLNHWLEFDVTPIVQGLTFTAPVNVAFTLDVGNGLGVSIDSKESKTTSQAPVLDIVYATAGAPGAQGATGATGATGLGYDPAKFALLHWWQGVGMTSTTSIYQVNPGPSGIAFDGANIWVSNINDSTVNKLSAATGEIIASYDAGGLGYAMAFDGANIWVTNSFAQKVSKLSAATGSLVGSYDVGASPMGIAFDGANIWVSNYSSQTVSKLSSATGATIGTYSVGINPFGIAFDGANIWVANEGSNTVSKLSAATGATIGSYAVGSSPSGIAFDGANIWVTNSGSKTVSKLSAIDGSTIGTYQVGSSPMNVAFDGSSIWVVNRGSNSLTRLSAATGATMGTTLVGQLPFGITFDGLHVWVTNSGSDKLSRF